MAGKKKDYYWIKLRKDFFQDYNIRRLRTISPEYVIIYLKMILMTVENQGIFECLPQCNFLSEFALFLDENMQKVDFVLRYVEEFGLGELWQNGIKINYTADNLGGETKWATYKRNEKQDNMNLSSQNSEIGKFPIEIGKFPIEIGKFPIEIQKKSNRGRTTEQSNSTEKQQQQEEQAFDNVVVALLKETGVRESEYKAIAAAYGADKAEEKLRMMAAEPPKSNPGGFLRAACMGDYQPPAKNPVTGLQTGNKRRFANRPKGQGGSSR